MVEQGIDSGFMDFELAQTRCPIKGNLAYCKSLSVLIISLETFCKWGINFKSNVAMHVFFLLQENRQHR